MPDWIVCFPKIFENPFHLIQVWCFIYSCCSGNHHF